MLCFSWLDRYLLISTFLRIILTDQQCGKLTRKAKFIEAGEKVKYSWPWMGSLGFKNGEDWVHKCGVSLVSQYEVITAAHCALDHEVLQKIAEGQLLVRLGNNNLSSNDTENIQEMSVQTMSVHPHYMSGFYHDLSILTFSSPVRITDTVNAVCLPLKPSIREALDDKGLVVTGWGEAGEKERELNQLIVKVFSNEICNLEYQNAPKETKRRYFPKNFTNNIFCTGDFTGISIGSTCNGDSGGPAIFHLKKVREAFKKKKIPNYGKSP